MLVKASHLFSKAPNTTFFILLFIIAPEHMTQGSSVTYNVHSSKYQDSNFLHASFIAFQNKAILFSAPSGTGKSTQADLWQKYVRGVEIINGDRAIIGIEDNGVKAYGLPFCGTSKITLNQSFNLSTIVILRQGKINKLIELAAKDGYKYLYSQVNWIWGRTQR